MAQINIADLLAGFKKDSNSISEDNLADNVNFPSLQNLIKPIANSPDALPSYAQEGLVNSDKYKDVRDEYDQKKAANLKDSNDFLARMVSDKQPLMLQQLLDPSQQSNLNAKIEEMPQEIQTSVAGAKQVPPLVQKTNFQQPQSSEQKTVAEKLTDVQNPLIDTQIKEAQAKAQQNMDTNQRRKALFEMMAGIGSLGGSKMSGESAALENAIKMQNAPVDQVNQERDAYKKFIDNREEMEKSDPNSPVSKTMRDALSGMGVKIPDNASYSTMEKLAPQLMANQQFKDRMADRALQREQMAQNRADREATRDDTRKLAGSEKVMRMVDDFSKTDDVKMFKATTVAKDAVNAAINAPNDKTRRGLLGPAFMLFAKIAQGDPSVVRESDIKMLTTNIGINPDIFGKIEAYAKGEKGISSQDLKNMQTILNLVENNKAEDIQGQYDMIRKRRDVLAKDTIGDQELFNPSVLKHLERVKSNQPKPNKPKTLIQNGHTYTLNEQTGEYE